MFILHIIYAESYMHIIYAYHKTEKNPGGPLLNLVPIDQLLLFYF